MMPTGLTCRLSRAFLLPAFLAPAFLSLAFLVSASAALADSDPVPEPDQVVEDARLWLGQPGPAKLLRPSQPSFERDLPAASAARAIAVDGERQRVWMRAGALLVSFDRDGDVAMSFAVEPIPGPAQLAVVPTDGSLWLAEGNSLRAIGPGGQLLHDFTLEAPIVDLEADPRAGRLWLATAESLESRDLISGQVQPDLRVDDLAGVGDIAIVPSTGTVWIAHSQGLETFSAEVGPPLLLRFDAGASQVATAIEDDRLIGIWVASGNQLIFLDPYRSGEDGGGEDGGAERWAKPIFGKDDPAHVRVLAVDGTSHSAWVSDGQRLVEAQTSFQTFERYDLGTPGVVRELAVLRPLRAALPPALEIEKPVRDEVVTSRHPEIFLRVTPGDDPVVFNTLELTVDGQRPSLQCHRMAGGFSCVPTTELPTGRLTLSATLADEAGRRSAPASVTFRIESRDDPGLPGEDEPDGEHGGGEHGGEPDGNIYTPIVSPRGVRPHTSFVAPDDIDFVDTASGNVTITLPLGQEYSLGPILSYQFQLVYNSRVWEYHNACDLSGFCGPESEPATFALTNPSNNAGLGWEMHFGRLFAPEPPSGLPAVDQARWPNHDWTEPSRWMYVSPSGASHFLYSMPGRVNSSGGRPVRTSKDGSFLRMVQTASHEIEIQFPNGLVSVFEKTQPGDDTDESLGTLFCGGGVSGCWRFRETRDLYGNAFSIGYDFDPQGREIWTVSDTAGRSHQVTLARGNNVLARGDCPGDAPPFCSGANEWGDFRAMVTQLDLAAFNDGVATYDLLYERHRITRGCPHNTDILPNGTDSIRLPLLQEVKLPGGVPPYRLAHNQPVGSSGQECNMTSGTVSGLTLPTGGKIEYEYAAWSFPTRCDYQADETANVDRTYSAPGLVHRQLLDGGTVRGDWLYSSALRFIAPVDAGQSCRRADYRVTTVDGPIDGDGGNNKGWRRTQYFHSLHDGPMQPSGPPNAPPLTAWQVQDQGLPFTKECQDGFPETDCVWDEGGLGPRFLSSRIFECTSASAQSGIQDRGPADCMRKRSTYVRYGAEWISSCNKLPPRGDGADCFKADAQRVAETTVFHDDLDSDDHPNNTYVDTKHSNYRGAGHFAWTTISDDFELGETPKLRWQSRAWDVGTDAAGIDGTSGHLYVGTPEHLPAGARGGLAAQHLQP